MSRNNPFKCLPPEPCSPLDISVVCPSVTRLANLIFASPRSRSINLTCGAVLESGYTRLTELNESREALFQRPAAQIAQVQERLS